MNFGVYCACANRWAIFMYFNINLWVPKDITLYTVVKVGDACIVNGLCIVQKLRGPIFGQKTNKQTNKQTILPLIRVSSYSKFCVLNCFCNKAQHAYMVACCASICYHHALYLWGLAICNGGMQPCTAELIDSLTWHSIAWLTSIVWHSITYWTVHCHASLFKFTFLASTWLEVYVEFLQ